METVHEIRVGEVVLVRKLEVCAGPVTPSSFKATLGLPKKNIYMRLMFLGLQGNSPLELDAGNQLLSAMGWAFVDSAKPGEGEVDIPSFLLNLDAIAKSKSYTSKSNSPEQSLAETAARAIRQLLRKTKFHRPHDLINTEEETPGSVTPEQKTSRP